MIGGLVPAVVRLLPLSGRSRNWWGWSRQSRLKPDWPLDMRAAVVCRSPLVLKQQCHSCYWMERVHITAEEQHLVSIRTTPSDGDLLLFAPKTHIFSFI